MSTAVVFAEFPVAVAENAALLERSGFTEHNLRRAVDEASAFHQRFRSAARLTTGSTLLPIVPSAPEQKFIRQSGGVSHAVVAKLGSNGIAKRKPSADHRNDYLDYVAAQEKAGAPLLFRVGVGPVKNVHHYGDDQQADIAEYLMLTNLARVMIAVATLYPHGLKVEMVPDDKRGGEANLWPDAYGKRYIAGVRDLADGLGLGWLKIEDGQERLYNHYKVREFTAAAEDSLRRWGQSNPEEFKAKLQSATDKAKDNLVTSPEARATKDSASDGRRYMESAWRYIVALKAEEMSGIFAPRDAFPLRYGNHPNSFQIYTMGEGQTKLPWQIALPQSLMPEHPAVEALRARPRAANDLMM